MAENVEVVCYAVEGKLLEQVCHECGGGVEECLQLPERDLLALVALVEDVLDLREPAGVEKKWGQCEREERGWRVEGGGGEGVGRENAGIKF